MTATERRRSDSSRRKGIFVSWRVIIIGLLIVAAAAFIYFIMRGTPVERGMAALVKAFEKRRPIEGRLSGGFKAGQFNQAGDDSSNINQPELERARTLIGGALSTGDASAYLAYGRLLASERKNDDAIKYLRLSLSAMPDSAQAHNDLGVCLIERGSIEDAIDEFETALKLKARMPEASFNRALCYRRLLLREAARKEFTDLLNVERDEGWRSEIQLIVNEASNKPQEALSDAQVVEQLHGAINSGDAEATRKLLTINFEHVSRHALDLYEEFLSGDNEKAAQVLSSIETLARLAYEANNDNTIATMAKYFRKLAEKDKPAELELLRLYKKGLADFKAQKTDEALASLEQARKAFKDRGNELFFIRASFAISRCQYSKNHFASSLETLKADLPAVRRGGWLFDESRSLLLIAIAYYRAGQDSTALLYLNQAQKVYRKLNEPEAKILQYAGVAYWHLGDFDKAIDYFHRSTALYLSNDPRGDELAYNYLNAADVYRITERYKLATLFSEQSLDIAANYNRDDNRAAQASSLMALTYAKEREFDKADEAMKQAFNYVSRLSRASKLLTAPLVYTRAADMAMLHQDYQIALDYYTEADSILETENGDKILKINALSGRAEALAKSGNDPLDNIKLAIDAIEDYRENLSNRGQRLEFLAASSRVYDQAISFYANQSLFQQAFAMTEASRARALLDVLASPVDNSSPVDSLLPKNPAGAEQSTGIPVPAFEKVQAALPDGVAVVEYALTSEKTYVFLITRSGFETLVLAATSAELSRMVSDYVSDIKNKVAISDLTKKAQALYQLLIEPVKSKLGSNRTLCIMPDKALHYLPFAALIDESGRYLISSFQLTYAPSVSVLVRCLDQKQIKTDAQLEKLLAVGNPEFNRDEFPQLGVLTEAEREASQVGRLYNDPIVLTQKQATERSVRESLVRCDIAHLALHCLVDRKSPWTAALVLASDKSAPPALAASESRERGGAAKNSSEAEPVEVDDPDDGLLYLKEVFKLALPRARLVVLSACESGLGHFYRGEGVVSLIHPFLAARVSTVVASLWPVESAATSELMIEFHRMRRSANLQAGDALRAAQLKMIEQGDAHPYYWASFIVVGSNY